MPVSVAMICTPFRLVPYRCEDVISVGKVRLIVTSISVETSRIRVLIIPAVTGPSYSSKEKSLFTGTALLSGYP